MVPAQPPKAYTLLHEAGKNENKTKQNKTQHIELLSAWYVSIHQATSPKSRTSSVAKCNEYRKSRWPVALLSTAKIAELRFLPLALLAFGQGLHAQQIPSAGSQMLQIPQSPTQLKTPAEIKIERGVPPVSSDAAEAKILVNTLRVSGAKTFTEAELLAKAGFTPGTQLSLGDLRGHADPQDSVAYLG